MMATLSHPRTIQVQAIQPFGRSTIAALPFHAAGGKSTTPVVTDANRAQDRSVQDNVPAPKGDRQVRAASARPTRREIQSLHGSAAIPVRNYDIYRALTCATA